VATQRRAVFLDKDGTVVPDIPFNIDPRRMELAPGAAEGLRLLAQAGYTLIVVSNQSGVARGYFREDALAGMQRRLRELCAAAGARLAGVYHCPHHPAGSVADYAVHCGCRKPEPGLLLRAAMEHGIACRRSWLVGDILNDVEAGRRAGCRSVLINNGNETEWILSSARLPHYIVGDLAEAARCIIASDDRPVMTGGREDE
jgi:histidinol-phosphate phosphatase family protein